jgi:hypothetical protein
MSNSRGDGEPSALDRLGVVVKQRASSESVWRAFLIAQTQVVTMRRREMTTQRMFLLGQRER